MDADAQTDGAIGETMGLDLGPPQRLYERLRSIGGYVWDESREPFHSSYDNWYVVPVTL